MLAEQQAAAALAGQQQGAANSPGDQQVDEQELRRRQKISAANKGRVPWNKGRKHPPEVGRWDARAYGGSSAPHALLATGNLQAAGPQDPRLHCHQMRAQAVIITLALMTLLAHPLVGPSRVSVGKSHHPRALVPASSPMLHAPFPPPLQVIARIKAATQAAMQRPDVRERLAKANERREPHTDAAKVRRCRWRPQRSIACRPAPA